MKKQESTESIGSKNREEIMIRLANGDSQETLAKKTGFIQPAICRQLKSEKMAEPIIFF